MFTLPVAVCQQGLYRTMVVCVPSQWGSVLALVQGNTLHYTHNTTFTALCSALCVKNVINIGTKGQCSHIFFLIFLFSNLQQS